MKSSDALNAFFSALAMSEAYLSTLEKLVLPGVPTADKKLAKSWRRTLSGHDALVLLQIIWKESVYISDAELVASGMDRYLPASDLCVNKLAKGLAATPEGEAALNKRIFTIMQAGVAYGLIEKRAVHAKHNVISGTEKLHHFMLMTAETWAGIVKGHRDGT